MTSFNESDINRDRTGKFAPKSTGETDTEAFFNAVSRHVPNSQDHSAVRAAEVEADALRQCSERYDHGFSGMSSTAEIDARLDEVETDLANSREVELISDEDYSAGVRNARRQADDRRAWLQMTGDDTDAARDVPSGYAVGDRTPFGTITERTEIGAGLAHVTTDRHGDGTTMHGGYVLSERRNLEMGALAKQGRFYEDDVDANLVAMRYPREMNVSTDAQARGIERQIAMTYPDRYNDHLSRTDPQRSDIEMRRADAVARSAIERKRLAGEYDDDAHAAYEAASNLPSDAHRSVLVSTHGENFRAEHARQVADLGWMQADDLTYRATRRRIEPGELS